MLLAIWICVVASDCKIGQNFEHGTVRNCANGELNISSFTNYSNWTRLSLLHNKLTSLPEGIFNGLSNLKWITLYDNQLTSLPKGIFKGLPKLERLQLENNQLTSLPKGIFKGLPKLERLHLGNNQLTAVPANIFPPNLTQLYLEHNKFTVLPCSVLNIPALERLVLDDNPFETNPLLLPLHLCNITKGVTAECHNTSQVPCAAEQDSGSDSTGGTPASLGPSRSSSPGSSTSGPPLVSKESDSAPSSTNWPLVITASVIGTFALVVLCYAIYSYCIAAQRQAKLKTKTVETPIQKAVTLYNMKRVTDEDVTLTKKRGANAAKRKNLAKQQADAKNNEARQVSERRKNKAGYEAHG